jgi:spore maturation protein CgeB
VAVYRTQPELISLVRELLSDSDMRNIMGENAKQHAYEKHTYDARMRVLIEKVVGCVY